MRASIVVGVVLAFTACKHDKTKEVPGIIDDKPDKSADNGKPVEGTDVDRPAATGSTCSVNTDCRISCDTKEGCCSDPACATAVMAHEAQEVLEYRDAHCTDAQIAKCPDVPAPKFTVRAVCQSGKCVAVKHMASEQLTPGSDE